MTESELYCPATMCPLMGLEELGSEWTGCRDAACETDCGWHRDGGCLVQDDLTHMLINESDHDEIPDGEWPACPHADSCQWQDQAAEGVPCPPRLAVMLNMDPTRCVF